MTIAMFRAMFLSLLHDRGALVMAFLLPVVFFIVLAEIFSGAAADDKPLRLAWVDEVGDDNSSRLITALLASEAIEPVPAVMMNRTQVENLVRRGTADIGLVVRADARAIDDVDGFGDAPLLVISDPIRGMMLPMLSGQLQKAYFEALPDVALGSVVRLIEDEYVEFDDEQRADLADGLAEMRAEAVAGGPAGWSFGEMIGQQSIAGQTEATNHVAYYAGAVAFLFLLFACMQGALSLVEERQSGILERIMTGPGGIAVLVNGKFLFLVAQGFVQMLLIFITAWLVYGVDLPGNYFAWLVITFVACIAAAGICLLIAAACRTPAQAQNLSTVIILIMSIMGGSMVPRFFMPVWMQEAGWFTPNTWVLEAYSAVFWRGETLAQIMTPLALLAIAGVTSLLTAQWIAARSARI